MTPRGLIILAALMALASLVTAIAPEHPVWNQPAGKYVLGIMAICCLVAAVVFWWRQTAPKATKPNV